MRFDDDDDDGDDGNGFDGDAGMIGGSRLC